MCYIFYRIFIKQSPCACFFPNSLSVIAEPSLRETLYGISGWIQCVFFSHISKTGYVRIGLRIC